MKSCYNSSIPYPANTGDMLLSFSPLSLSQRKSIKSLTEQSFADDSFDEIINYDGINNFDDERLIISVHLDEALNELDLYKNNESDKQFLAENNFINSPLFKKCVRRSAFAQRMTIGRMVSPFISRLQRECVIIKESTGEAAIKKLIRTSKSVMKSPNFEVANMLDKYLDNSFKELSYLNQRSIILKVIDKSGSFIQSGMNEKYISAYNAFHFPVTFTDINEIKHRKDNIIDFKAYHVFDNQAYWLRHSISNWNHIHEQHKSTLLLRNEVLILSSCTHPNVVRYFSSWIEYQCLYEQLEYAPGGCLDDYIQNNMNRPNRIFNLLNANGGTKKISNNAAMKLIRHITSAVAYIQTLNLVHGYISTENVLIFPCKCKDGNIDWVEKGLQGDGPIVFKLAGFERCVERLNIHSYQDVRDTAVVAIRALLGIPRLAFDDMWARVFPIGSWCANQKLCNLLEAMTEGVVESASDIEKFIAMD